MLSVINRFDEGQIQFLLVLPIYWFCADPLLAQINKGNRGNIGLKHQFSFRAIFFFLGFTMRSMFEPPIFEGHGRFSLANGDR